MYIQLYYILYNIIQYLYRYYLHTPLEQSL